MLKLILVDDEPIIRKGIATSIKWDVYEIEVVGEASNGVDALELARSLKPDIVITDIRMPLMDGLELSSILKKELPDSKIVILSGYDDFEYAKRALSIGIYEYLLKPVEVEDLITLIIKLNNEISMEQSERNRDMLTNMAFNNNFPYIKSNFINELLNGEYNDIYSIYSHSEMLKINLPVGRFFVIVIDIDDFYTLTENMTEKNKELLKFSVMNLSEDLLSHVSGLVAYMESGHLIGIINSININEIEINKYCKDIQFNIKKYLKLSISIGVGNSYESILDVYKSYSEALTALRSKIYSGKNSIIIFNSKNKLSNIDNNFYPSKEEMEIISYVSTLNIDGLNTIIDNIFSKFIYYNTKLEDIRSISFRLIAVTDNYIEKMGLLLDNIFDATINPYKEVMKFSILEDFHQWFKFFYERIITFIQNSKTWKFTGIIKTVLKYLEENYQTNLTLSEVADKVHVTPNYLSRIFKEEMGVNFVAWLNQFRIERAKSLLIQTGSKSYEVAEKVGYGDYKYFSYIFKKYAGCSPKEYKEKH